MQNALRINMVAIDPLTVFGAVHIRLPIRLDASVATYLMMRASPGFGAEAIRIRPNVAKSTFTIAW